MLDLKIGNRIKVLLPCDGKTSVQYETGKIIYIGRRALVQFDTNVCGHNGNGIGKDRHCWMMDWDKLIKQGD